MKLGSLFAGIGGFELGLERAIPGLETIWQVEQDLFCQKVLKKHWPDSIIYNDVCTVGKHNLEPVDIICGGFPCQDISNAGKQGGIYAKRSGLWWEMLRVISEIRPRVAIMENVSALLVRGLPEVLGSLAQIGYDSEWSIVPAGGPKGFGAPHQRKRVFIVAYSNSVRLLESKGFKEKIQSTGDNKLQSEKIPESILPESLHSSDKIITNSKKTHSHGNRMYGRFSEKITRINYIFHRTGFGYWRKTKAPPPVCRMDDGIPHRVDRLRSLGNAIVPQCSEWIGKCILESGILDIK